MTAAVPTFCPATAARVQGHAYALAIGPEPPPRPTPDLLGSAPDGVPVAGDAVGDGGASVDRGALEVLATIERVVWRDDTSGWTVMRLAAPAESSAKGPLRVKPRKGLQYHMTGKWAHDARFGWAFVFDDARLLEPTTSDAVIAYLAEHAPNVGPAIGAALYRAFGAEAIEIARTDPERCSKAARGLTLERAREVQAALVELQATEAAEVDLRGVCAPARLSRRQLRSILDRYRSQAGAVVRENPYRLIDEVLGVGWVSADAIGRGLGLAEDSPERLRAAVVHALGEAEQEGHTCISRGDARARVAKLTGCAAPAIDAAISRAVASKDLAGWDVADTDLDAALGLGEARVWRRETWEAERAIAEAVVRLSRGGAA